MFLLNTLLPYTILQNIGRGLANANNVDLDMRTPRFPWNHVFLNKSTTPSHNIGIEQKDFILDILIY